MTKTTEFYEGRSAFENGFPNPYESTTQEYRDWEEGYSYEEELAFEEMEAFEEEQDSLIFDCFD